MQRAGIWINEKLRFSFHLSRTIYLLHVPVFFFSTILFLLGKSDRFLCDKHKLDEIRDVHPTEENERLG